jgi:hypothetical protein
VLTGKDVKGVNGEAKGLELAGGQESRTTPRRVVAESGTAQWRDIWQE